MSKQFDATQIKIPDDPELYKVWKNGYESGVFAAAEFAGGFDKQVTGLNRSLRDTILSKFNLTAKK